MTAPSGYKPKVKDYESTFSSPTPAKAESGGWKIEEVK
jgi:hypothetical protein